MAEDNKQPQDWHETLPEELKSDPSLKDFKDPASLAKSYVETKALVGKSIRPPGDGAAADVKKKFVDDLLRIEPALIYAPDGDKDALDRMWKKLGKPAKPEEYDFPDAAKAAGLNETDLRNLAAKTGLTKAQFNEIVGTMTAAALESKRLAALERVSLEQEWGDAKEERTLAAQAAALKMGLTEDDVKSLTPRQLRVFHNVAKAVGVNNGEFRRQGESASDAPLDPTEAMRQMDEIRSNPDYFDPFRNPAAHRVLVAKMSKLAESAYK
jgi:hypothetical protein